MLNGAKKSPLKKFFIIRYCPYNLPTDETTNNGENGAFLKENVEF